VLKILAWLAVGFVSGASIRAWLVPAAASPLGVESGANLRVAGAERASEYSGLTRRIRALEVSRIERANEHAELITRLAALEEEARALANALATASNRQSGAPASASPDALVGALALRFWSGPPGAVVSTAEQSAAPWTLVGVEAEPGKVLIYEVTGSAEGVIFGTDIYTDDSSIAVAAVHSGALRPNETGTIMVSVVPGRDSYTGSSRYGIESEDCAEWSRSYTLRRLQ
jgi:hypothetical protein